MAYDRRDPPHNWSFEHGDFYGHIPPGHLSLKKRVGWKQIDEEFVQHIKKEKAEKFKNLTEANGTGRDDSEKAQGSPRQMRKNSDRKLQEEIDESFQAAAKFKANRRKNLFKVKSFFMVLSFALLCTGVCFIIFFSKVEMANEELWRWFLVLAALTGAYFLINAALYVSDFLLQLIFRGESLIVYLLVSVHRSRCLFFHVALTFGLWAGLMKDVSFHKPVLQVLGCLWVFTGALLFNRIMIKWFHHGFYKTFYQQMFRAILVEHFLIVLQKNLLGMEHTVYHSEFSWSNILRILKEIKLATAADFHLSFASSLFDRREVLRDQPHMMQRMAHYIMKNKHLPLLLSNASVPNRIQVVFIEEKGDADKLGKKLFRSIRENKQATQIQRTDFEKVLEENEVNAFYDLNDMPRNEPVSMQSFTDFFKNSFSERLSLCLTLRDAEEVLGKLGWATGSIVAIPTLTVWLIIFGINVLELWLAIASLLVSLSFIFGNSIRVLYENVIFIFVVHPFDVNDWIEVAGNMYLVQRIGMHTTTLSRVDGRTSFIRTADLNTDVLLNLTRSGNSWEVFDLYVDMDTPTWVFLRLSERLNELFELDKESYKQFRVVYRGMEQPLKMYVAIIVEFALGPAELGNLHWGRTRIMAAIREVMVESKVQYSMPPLQATVHKAGSHRSVPGADSNLR
mmetsp:Transcript_5271/g.33124  ORF Transcript_5271/g.33124 Transcript_5271/m.33124 type:complete len:679 (-) Transcript_5271:700-2736(-)